MCGYRQIIYVMGLLTSFIITGGNAMAGGFSPHFAVYDLDLKSSTSSSNVKTIDGRTSYRLERSCDGWTAVEDYAISFGIGDSGRISNFISHYETWESYSGTAFSFNVVENSTITGENSYEGFANISDGMAEAFFLDSEEGSQELPENTVFPVKHMQDLLSLARKGKKVHQSTLFLGGDQEDAIYFVSTIIGNRKEVTPDELLGSLGQDSYWPLRIAYFNPDAADAEPDYEIQFDMQENGIIRSYSVDYGDFVMRARLNSIEPVTEKGC
ncbi:DUF1849 family protein [Alphaproteobacteria bacterium LSUCC0684]